MLSTSSKWIVWGIIAGLDLGMFFVLKMIAHATVWGFAVPYLVTLVMPVPIFVQISAWLRKWELRRPPLRLLALCWALAVAVFAGGISTAMLYYSAKFGVFHPDLGEYMFVVGLSAISASLGMYFQVLPMITARARTSPT